MTIRIYFIQKKFIDSFLLLKDLIGGHWLFSGGMQTIALLSLLLSGIFLLQEQASLLSILTALLFFFLGFLLLNIVGQSIETKQENGLKSINADNHHLILILNKAENNLDVLQTVHLATDKIYSIEFPEHAKRLLSSMSITLRIRCATHNFSFTINPKQATHFNRLIRLLKRHPHIHFYPYYGLRLPTLIG